MNLSVIIPVYNEEKYLEEIIARVANTKLVYEIICVDDGSTDQSKNLLKSLSEDRNIPLKVLTHPQNRGKGAAIKTGLSIASGDLVLIQDADLEYNPKDYEALIKPFNEKCVHVVYGSRNLIRNPKSSLAFYYGGRLLSILTNIIYGSKITDESTCYKVFKTELLRDLNLENEGFDFCPEVTAKILKQKIKIHEVPISYSPRSRNEGKKIRWYDGIIAIWTLLKYRIR
ncbi:MAG: glycosyltransferase family 2 protein [Ignavibacteriae bacterium]|nr:glycosyltransferase family 2 protein [Ignavibacteriota bacterium]MCB9243744.1 glycosyltransferase family 2 protein [Ignavibacteriales bacterium]